MLSFDQELELIEFKLDRLNGENLGSSSSENTLHAMQKRLLEIESAFPKWMQTFSLTPKQIESLKRENLAVAQWSSKIAKLARTRYEAFARSSDQAFWVTLMLERIAKDNAQDTDEEFDELVNLVVKISEITDIERRLDHEIQNLQLQIKKLQNEYSQLGVADTNWDASGSMQARLSEKSRQFFDNPPSRSLASLFKFIRACSSWRSDDRLRSNEMRLSALSDRLAKTGAALGTEISRRTDNDHEQDGSQDRAAKLNALIEEVSTLEKSFSSQFNQYMNELPKNLTPRIRSTIR